MIVDIDKSAPDPSAGRYDVCIAGGGVAGITLAYTLAARGQRILLLEAGGLEYTDKSQSVYKGENVGDEYFDLDVARLRYLGGSSNHWGGRCRPLDPYDFEKHAHIEGSGWPIDITDLDPYLAESRKILEIDDFPSDDALKESGGRLKEIFFRFSPPVRFGEKYHDFLKSSDAVHVFLNANLVDIKLDTASGRISAFAFRGYASDAPVYWGRANQYVLALGGIENARAMLNANRQVPNGLGNEYDLVGRFFMEHPNYDIGYYIADSSKTKLGEDRRFVAPTIQLMRRERIANAGFRLLKMIDRRDDGFVFHAKELFRDALCASDVIADLIRTIRPFHCRPTLDVAGRLRVQSEQVPNPNSRVELGTKTDRFGLRRVELDWQHSPMDKKTIRVGGLEIAKQFARWDIGRVKLFDWVLDESHPRMPGLKDGEKVGGNHHMGTTRMGASQRDGVVDRNCRVFGVENLYIAGSSVFRTGGHANPTLTIIQLALRLRDHLARLV